MSQMVHSGAHKCSTKVVIPAGEEKTISEDEYTCSKVYTSQENVLKLLRLYFQFFLTWYKSFNSEKFTVFLLFFAERFFQVGT